MCENFTVMAESLQSHMLNCDPDDNFSDQVEELSGKDANTK